MPEVFARGIPSSLFWIMIYIYFPCVLSPALAPLRNPCPHPYYWFSLSMPLPKAVIDDFFVRPQPLSSAQEAKRNPRQLSTTISRTPLMNVQTLQDFVLFFGFPTQLRMDAMTFSHAYFARSLQNPVLRAPRGKSALTCSGNHNS